MPGNQEGQGNLRCSFLLQLGIPVHNQRERHSARWGVGLRDQKTPAISGHIKGPKDPRVVGWMKERSWRPKRDLLSLFVDVTAIMLFCGKEK